MIPVLADGASMPAASDLPEPLRSLTRRQALEVSDRHFHRDVDRLVEAIEEGGRKAAIWHRRPVWATVVLLALAALGFGLWRLLPGLSRPGGGTASQAEPAAGLWAGEWTYVCDTKLGPIRGQMVLEAEGAAGIAGAYNDRTVSGTIRAKVEGAADTLAGTWKNDQGQEGRFVFRLRLDRRSFDGSYSMSLASEPPQDSNSWSGARKD